MDNIGLIFYAFTLIWFFGGLIFFAYIKWETLSRKTKNAIITVKQTAVTTKQKGKEICKELFWGAALLSPFLIPIIVTLLCLYFE